MEQPKELQGIKSLIPEAPKEQQQGGPELPGPVFEAGPGWGKRLSDWLKRNFFRLLFPIIAIIVVIVGIALVKNRDAENVELPGLTQIIEKQKEPIEKITVTKGGEEKKIYKAAAQRGEGITHLARKTLKEYLKDKPELAAELKAEHKIYVEDYLKDRHGEKLLEIGEVLEFSTDDVETAIEVAKGLSDSDLVNLSQYVPLVSGL